MNFCQLDGVLKDSTLDTHSVFSLAKTGAEKVYLLHFIASLFRLTLPSCEQTRPLLNRSHMDSQAPSLLGNLCHQGKRHRDLNVVLVKYQYHDDTNQIHEEIDYLAAVYPHFFLMISY